MSHRLHLVCPFDTLMESDVVESRYSDGVRCSRVMTFLSDEYSTRDIETGR